jgi:hypothetical protein
LEWKKATAGFYPPGVQERALGLSRKKRASRNTLKAKKALAKDPVLEAVRQLDVVRLA